ncbi:hypothetical protein [Sphingomonas sp. 28-63-12]|uniref:hypothetical protein n=1 Tax=Sphingomonas sp. 28-63-12 TaxID=1970434 RepID=UPI000BC772B6|nr:MAG: hypothetical protein B7Y47_13980 [Sphingomonas sp. 28-63-12]
MRIMMLATLLLLTGGAADARNAASKRADEADAIKVAKALDGLTPGKPQSCISPFPRDYHTQTIGDTILYRVSKNLIYRNEAPGCHRAETGDALVSVNYGAQLCRGQIIRTVDLFSRTLTGSCALGEFTPYTKAK